MRHPLTRAVAAALPRPRPADAAAFLALLERRLAVLAALARGETPAEPRVGQTRRERALARRFLRRFEETWDDGDENLVRGYLDRWSRGTESPRQVAARSLIQAADELARLEARPGTLFFFLWEMESMLASGGGPC